MLSSEVRRLKESEGGMQVMCEVMQRYEKMAAEAAKHEERMQTIKNMIAKGYTKESILDLDYTEEEYAEAESEFAQQV